MVTAIPFLIAIPEHTPLGVYLQFDVWSNFLFLGVFCSMIAFIIWAFTVKGLGAIKPTTIFMYNR